MDFISLFSLSISSLVFLWVVIRPRGRLFKRLHSHPPASTQSLMWDVSLVSGFFFPSEIPSRPGDVSGEALRAGPATPGGLLQRSEPPRSGWPSVGTRPQLEQKDTAWYLGRLWAVTSIGQVPVT